MTLDESEQPLWISPDGVDAVSVTKPQGVYSAMKSIMLGGEEL